MVGRPAEFGRPPRDAPEPLAPPGTRPLPAAWRLLWLAVGLAAFAWLTALSRFWLDTPLGERFDAVLASPAIHGLPWGLREGLSTLARPLLPVALAALAAVLLVPALRARRARAVLTALLVPAASLALLVVVRDGWAGLGSPAFPSGHAVAGYAVLVSVACLWPLPVGARAGARGRGWRAAVAGRWGPALWGLALATVTVGNVTLHAHLPGEVIGAALLVTGVSGLLLGILAPRPVRDAAGPKRGTMGPP
ncbi:MAG: hypothetical protein GX555_19995 [Actinomycetales bacterium]|nr:hypothetical protein [Actinomycetales bacterium]